MATDTRERRPPLTKEEAATYLGVSVRWVIRATNMRRIPFYKVGQFLRYSPDDLDSWLLSNKVEPVPQPRRGRPPGRRRPRAS